MTVLGYPEPMSPIPKPTLVCKGSWNQEAKGLLEVGVSYSEWSDKHITATCPTSTVNPPQVPPKPGTSH